VRKIVAALLVIALVAVVAVAMPRQKDERAYYFSVRSFVLMQRAADWPGGGVLVVGDSLSEMSAPATLCGLPVFNAGISGSRVSDWGNLAPELVRLVRPRLVVIALGTNDARRSLRFDASQWQRHYSRIVRPGFILVAPPAVEPGKQYGTGYYDPARLANISAMIDRLPNPIAKPGELPTLDGVHPNESGRAAWVAAVERSCPTS
jgi:lysophospholipase L1-like esterase